MEKGQRIGVAQHEMSVTESVPLVKAVDIAGNGEQQAKGFAKTQAFLREALAEGAHLKIPFWIRHDGYTGHVSEKQWVRQKNIVGIYFGSPASREDIGRSYGVTRERISRVIKQGVLHLWQNSTPEIQATFPFEELALNKPLSQRSREKASLAGGGTSILLKEEIKTGRSVKQIQEGGVLSGAQIFHSRRVLRTWGIEVPYTNTSKFQNIELEKRLRAAEKDEEKQNLLGKVKRNFYHSHLAGEDPVLMPIGTLIREAGLTQGFQNRNLPIFLGALRNIKFPMGEIVKKYTAKTGDEKPQTYRFILAKDKERAKQIPLADPNLQRFRRS